MYSVQTAVSDGTLTSISVSIDYIDESDITVTRSDESDDLVSGTDYTWTNSTTITFTETIPEDVTITLLRSTDYTTILNTFNGNTPFTRTGLEENFEQVLYIAQESTEQGQALGYYRDLNMNSHAITELEDPTDDQDAATKSYVDDGDDALDSRVTTLETIVSENDIGTLTFWSTTTTEGQTTYDLGSTSVSNVVLYLGGVAQMEGADNDYTVSDGVITLTEAVPEAGLNMHGTYYDVSSAS